MKVKNSPLDIITIVMVIFVFAVGSIMAMNVFDGVNSDIQDDLTLNNDTKDLSGGLYDKYPSTMDSAFMLAFVLLVVFVLVSVFMLDTHPIFFIVSVVLLIMIFIVTMLLGNVYDDIMLDSDFSSYANQLPYTSWVMGHILELMMAVGFIVLIALFIKFKGT